ncbi:uncharacterized protein LOC131954754 [Physella acuta]|uniref:uncharacterized protein LOC131954754 n=1 Tax=Physella acuta TaxID=109671 RepID=UPI0027DBB978|nr:uncharacterized protein LOC131954754 [Physella acuta]
MTPMEKIHTETVEGKGPNIQTAAQAKNPMNFPELACRLTDGNKENHPGSSLIRKSEDIPYSSISKCDLSNENIYSVTIAKDILPLFQTSSSEMFSISKPSTISSSFKRYFNIIAYFPQFLCSKFAIF